MQVPVNKNQWKFPELINVSTKVSLITVLRRLSFELTAWR